MRRLAAILLAMAPISGAMAASGANGFVVVNATGVPLAKLEVRRVGSDDWRPLPVDAATGDRISSRFVDGDCAYDLRAAIPNGGHAIWRGLNLCDVKSVELHRDASGRTWVDYD